MTTYSDLAEASGMLGRAAQYLLARYGVTKLPLEQAQALGILMGLAYQVRPQLVKV